MIKLKLNSKVLIMMSRFVFLRKKLLICSSSSKIHKNNWDQQTLTLILLTKVFMIRRDKPKQINETCNILNLNLEILKPNYKRSLNNWLRKRLNVIILRRKKTIWMLRSRKMNFDSRNRKSEQKNFKIDTMKHNLS